MTRHHFVPLSIISTFASAQAWRVVNATPEKRAHIAHADQLVIASGQKRNWPICVYDKEHGSLARKLARDVCSALNLYGVLNYDDQLIRGLIRYNLQSEETPLRNLDDLLRLGAEPLDSDMIERTHIGEIDSSFAILLPALRAGKQLSDEQIGVVLRFVSFARFRTPSWHRVHYPEAYERSQKQIKALFIRGWNEKHTAKLSGRSLEAINTAIDSNLYPMAIIQACNRTITALHQVNARILVLHNSGTVPFVTCDNPARPYFPDRIRRIASEALPGMRDPRSQITYPIEPNTCLLVSSNPTYPAFTHTKVSEKQVRKINCALALMADKEIIFAGPDANAFENWIELNQMKPIRRP